jgi:hypothetical protein
MRRTCAPCSEMVFHINDPSLPLSYDARFDEYFISRTGSSVQVLKYCPFCGGNLPPSRRDQFFDELEQQGVEFELGSDDDVLPERYRKPHWWLTAKED